MKLTWSISLSYFDDILFSAPQATTIRIPISVSAATPDASLSTSWIAVYRSTTNGIVIEYQTMIITSPLAVTSVNSQL
jgi:hypothetical protein